MLNIRSLKFRILGWVTDPSSNHFYHEQIGMISVAWALLEMNLDRLNELLIAIPGAEAYEQSLPVSLSRKLKFIRKVHGNLPILQTLQADACGIADRVQVLKEKRHDLIHGFAKSHPPSGLRDLVRFHFDGPSVKEIKAQYSNNDLRFLLDSTHLVGKDVIAHYVAVAKRTLT